MPSENSFLILGNSVSGTSLLHGLLNHHPKLHVEYEWFRHKKNPDKCLAEWVTAKNKHLHKIWGNKIPVEQFFVNGWTDKRILRLLDHFKIIFIQRRYSMYAKDNVNNLNYLEWWQRGNHILYWKLKEAAPLKVLAVSFEDLCARPIVELQRICDFINISLKYDDMIKGTVNGKSRQTQLGFDLTRI